MSARRSAALWLGLLFAAAAAVFVVGGWSPPAPAAGAAPADSGPSSTTTTTPASTTTTTTATTTTGPAHPQPVSFGPCDANPCSQTPQLIEVLGVAPAVEVDWQAGAAAAPQPASTSVVLVTPDQKPAGCPPGYSCWSWPSQMMDGSFILNGTYQVAACTTVDASPNPPSCTADPARTARIAVTVPPDPPASVSASVQGAQVAVTWTPPVSAPPDLAGYEVFRNASTEAVYTCSTDTLGPGAGTPCPANLTFADTPGDGEYTYSVSTIRLGKSSGAADVVTSSAKEDSGGVVAVPGPVSSPAGSQAGPGGGSAVTLPAGGRPSGPATVEPQGPSVTLPAPTTVTSNPVAATPATLPAIDYPPVTAASGRRSALALQVASPAPTDVVPVAVLALGILALAIAAHFLYLRVEVGAIQARTGSPGASWPGSGPRGAPRRLVGGPAPGRFGREP